MAHWAVRLELHLAEVLQAEASLMSVHLGVAHRSAHRAAHLELHLAEAPLGAQNQAAQH